MSASKVKNPPVSQFAGKFKAFLHTENRYLMHKFLQVSEPNLNLQIIPINKAILCEKVSFIKLVSKRTSV